MTDPFDPNKTIPADPPSMAIIRAGDAQAAVESAFFSVTKALTELEAVCMACARALDATLPPRAP